ncbi:MAG: hypothetical protein ABFD25_03190 [Clostridiaceae bacterium]
MIQQQYYTRERRGIFRSTEGYDSIAKSAGLKNDFIKRTLHAFCFYDTPRELQESQEKDLEKYPKALTCFNTDTGDLVLGRSVYVGADFTGLRNTFFTHNYVIPGSSKEEFLRNIQKILCVSDFKDSYNIENGQDLPECDDIACEKSADFFSNAKDVFKVLGVDEEIFKKLLFAVFSSISGRKKVYVSINTDAAELSEYAKELLKFILLALPYDLRKNFGFITYIKDPDSKMFINMMFVDKGSIKVGDSKIEKDFIFDFVHERYVNTEVDLKSNPYLDFVWNSLWSEQARSEIKWFHDFAEEAKPVRRFDLEAYNELCSIWTIKEKGDLQTYEANREMILKNIYMYMDTASPRLRGELDRLFTDLFGKEDRDMRDIRDYLPAAGILDVIIRYYDMALDAVRKKINNYFISIINKAKNMNRAEYVAEVFRKVNEREYLFKRLIETIFEIPAFISVILEGYLRDRFARTNKCADIIDEIKFWGKTSPDVVKYQYFQTQAKKDLIRLFAEEKNKLAEDKLIQKGLEDFVKNCPAGSERASYESYAKDLSEAVKEIAFRSLEPEYITNDNLSAICRQFSAFRNEPNYKILRCLEDLLAGGYDLSEEKAEALLFELDNIYVHKFKELIKKLFAVKINYDNYPIIILAFKNDRRISEFDIYNRAAYDYGGVIKYISGKSVDEVFKFIFWAYEENVFSERSFFSDRNSLNRHDITDRSVKGYSEFDKAAMSFIEQEGNSRLKDKNFRNKLKLNRELKNIMAAVDYKNAGPVKKFYIDHSKNIGKLIFWALEVFLIVASALIIMFEIILPRL